MSHTEFHAGKLELLDLRGLTIEEWCKLQCVKENVTELKATSWLNQFNWSSPSCENYIIVGDKIYKILEHFTGDDMDYEMRLFPQEDGSISFVGQFYNGGTCFEEMIEEALTQHQKDGK